MALRAMELYDAYEKNMLPKDEGYVVSAFYLPDSPYSILEVISYSEVKNFFAAGDSLTFQSNGKKLYILVEPSSYNHKSQEPYVRPSKYQIPLRFNDLNIYTCKNQYKIMYNKEPQMVMTSFTVTKPSGNNFSLIVFQQDGIQDVLTNLFQTALHNESNVPMSDSKKVGEALASMIVEKLAWLNKKKVAPAKKASAKHVANKATPAKKTAPAKKAASKVATKKPVAKTTSKKASASKKEVPVKKVAAKAPVKKAVPVKKAATKAPAKKAVPAKKATAKPVAKKAAPAKKATAKPVAKKEATAKKSNDKTVVAKKPTTAKKATPAKKSKK